MASAAFRRVGQVARLMVVSMLFVLVVAPTISFAAPYAAMVVDARNGRVIHSRNADTPLHPASLTKMMTLYIVFEAVEHGEISLDSLVTISRNAAAEPPSKIGFHAGQKVRLRHLIRAAAVKSANDAATALGEAIAGSEEAFAARMNRTAKALGMNNTHFVNMHGLTADGHLSTARDMTTLGRHLFFDYPAYYNLFSRTRADVGVKTVPSTNRRFLNTYEGADGIKTGYTSASGSNLTASARRGNKHIIATIFGGQSGPSRDAKMAELMDMGFREAANNVAVRPTQRPAYVGPGSTPSQFVEGSGGAGKTIRLVGAPQESIRPRPRPGQALDPESAEVVSDVIADILANPPEETPAQTETEETGDETIVAAAETAPTSTPLVNASLAAPKAAPSPPPRPDEMILTKVESSASATPATEFVTRMSTSGGRHWGINVGSYNTEYEAERVLLRTALNELTTLGDALRKVARSRQGFNANFVGMTREGAELACRRLSARNTACTVIEVGAS
ncbi:MAG: D-alanyl-D-alanine carboxypeptidase family protein [Maritimibacter harenae]|jgi:D-alanyl-D-alanine carboxypeptidase